MHKRFFAFLVVGLSHPVTKDQTGKYSGSQPMVQTECTKAPLTWAIQDQQEVPQSLQARHDQGKRPSAAQLLWLKQAIPTTQIHRIKRHDGRYVVTP